MTIALLFPELLGTYGDRGNVVVLARRLAWRGIPHTVVEVRAGEPVPSRCDIYVLGGGEDDPQEEANVQLLAGAQLQRAVDDGAALLAVCAGYQIAGTTFETSSGEHRGGLGIIDCVTTRPHSPRSVGEVLVDAAEGLPRLSGYENHAGLTRRGPGVEPLGRVRQGMGNGDGTEGVRQGHVIATYLHGPVLARNPALADLLLSYVVGDLVPIDDHDSAQLRSRRARAARVSRWRRTVWPAVRASRTTDRAPGGG